MVQSSFEPIRGPLLCATDFSPSATQAGQVAAALSRSLGLPMVLTHVLDEGALGASEPETRSQLDASATRRLESELKRIAPKDRKSKTLVLHGRPEVELIREAGNVQASLVIVGSLGHVAVRNFVIGSVAERVVEGVQSPCLVVHHHEPLCAWAESHKPLRILLAFDGSATSEAAARSLSLLRRIGPCLITAAHVRYPAAIDPRKDHQSSSIAPRRQEPADGGESMERELRSKLIELTGDSSMRIRVEANWGATADALVRMAIEEGADLIVLGTHQRRGWRRLWHASISRALLHHAPMNVLCVPSGALGAAGSPLPEYHQVLVATDLSELGNRAVPFAAGVLSQGGVLRILHVLEPSKLKRPRGRNVAELKKTSHRTGEDQIRCVQDKLASLVGGAANARGIVVETAVVASTEVAREIVEEARRCGADLVCLGSHGRTGWKAMVLGSVAQCVAAQCAKPVMLVGPSH